MVLVGHLHSYPGAHGVYELWAVSYELDTTGRVCVSSSRKLAPLRKVIHRESRWRGSPSANREAALVLTRCVSIAHLPLLLPDSQVFLCEGTMLCSQNSPVYPWTNLLADFWRLHLRNEFIWCYANPKSVIHTLAWMIMGPDQDWLSISPHWGTRKIHWVSYLYFTLP